MTMQIVTNRWLLMIEWCKEHNIDYKIGFQWDSGEGYCDDTAEDTIEIETPEGKLVLFSRPNENLRYDEYRITALQKEIDQLINEDDVREDSTRVTSRQLKLNQHKANLFMWGFTESRKVDSEKPRMVFDLAEK